jgi:2-keto-3-deoxy-L-fuconate dehydrogenase
VGDLNLKSMFSLENKVAVITGGGSGIGLAISKLFANQGAKVVVLEYNENNAEEVENEIVSMGGKVSSYIVDVSNQKMVLDVFGNIGNVDILVNNAGIAHIGNAITTTTDDLERIYQTNIKGYYNCMKAALENMLEKKSGVILNMASAASFVGIADRFAYSMSKGAVVVMTLSVAKDFINKGIRCNSISPGRVHTPFVDGYLDKNYPENKAEMFEKLSKAQPIGRMGQPDEIAALALYLCSDEAAFVTGCDYKIDGGFVTLNN